MPRSNRLGFDHNEVMPESFRERLRKVLRDPPTSQHDFYPELMAYLGIKFRVDKGFLPKPQKMMRLLAGMSPHDFDTGYGQLSGGEPMTFNASMADRNRDILSATTTGSARTTDSNAREVRITWHNAFPDIAIEQFFGRQSHSTTDEVLPDVLRVLVEVGWCADGLSPREEQTLCEAVVKQLMGYMLRATKAWTGNLWGIAIVRKRFTYVQWNQPNTGSTDYDLAHAAGDWYPLDSLQFIRLLNQIQQWCLAQYEIHAPHGTIDDPSAPSVGPKFDPRANLPVALQQRIDDWKSYTPRQFSAYGPLTAYLSWVFPLDKYLVKPQRRVVKRRPMGDDPQHAKETNNKQRAVQDPCSQSISRAGLRGDDRPVLQDRSFQEPTEYEAEELDQPDDEQDDERELGEEEEGSFPEEDADDQREGEDHVSNGDEDRLSESVSAISTQLGALGLMDPVVRVVYPDFTVDRYQATGNAATDKICLILEVGQSPGDLEKKRAELRTRIQRQLHGYMIASLQHFEKQLYGIAICGTDFCYMRATDTRGERRLTTGQNVPAGEGSFRANVRWGSIFAARWEKIMRSASRS